MADEIQVQLAKLTERVEELESVLNRYTLTTPANVYNAEQDLPKGFEQLLTGGVSHNLVFSDNTPAGYVAWSAGTLTFEDLVYEITAGSTNYVGDYWLYWDEASPNQISGQADNPPIDSTKHVIGYANTGYYTPVVSALLSFFLGSRVEVRASDGQLVVLAQSDGSGNGAVTILDTAGDPMYSFWLTCTIYKAVTLKDGIDLNIEGDGTIRFDSDSSGSGLAGSAGALAGYITVKHRSGSYKVPLYAVS